MGMKLTRKQQSDMGIPKSAGRKNGFYGHSGTASSSDSTSCRQRESRYQRVPVCFSSRERFSQLARDACSATEP